MDIEHSPEYKSFRSSVSLKKIVVDDGTAWSYYDAGPRTVQNPIIFLPPVSGAADIFFRQLLTLSGAGYRAIAINHPVVWNVESWCLSFNSFLNSLQIDRVHVFGASLGGFLSQKYAEFSGNGRRVRSMILCNAFNDTDVFKNTATSSTFWAVPAVVLKKLVLGNFDTSYMDREMIAAVNFMVHKLDTLSQQELASRLTLNCVSSYVEPQNVQVISSDITLMNVFDEHALSGEVHNEMNKLYPSARKALLKTGGNFPYLSRSDEVNIYIQVHLQQYADTIYSACEPRSYAEDDSQPSTSTTDMQSSTVTEPSTEQDVIEEFNTSMAELEVISEERPERTETVEQTPERGEEKEREADKEEVGTDVPSVDETKDNDAKEVVEEVTSAVESNDNKAAAEAVKGEETSPVVETTDNEAAVEASGSEGQADAAHIVEDFEINNVRM